MSRIGERLLKQSGLKLTNLDKVLWPSTGTTKLDMLEYYYEVAPVMLSHIRQHPITMKRFPEGVRGDFFYEKRCPPWRPSWANTCPVPNAAGSNEIAYCMVADVPSLLWVANLGSIELHPLLGTCRRPERPSSMVFDLDPGPPAGLLDCVRVARAVRRVLKQLGLESVVKTSGGKGLHLWVPLNTNATFEQTKHFAHAVALLMEKEHPTEITSIMRKTLRRGKVLIDWSQNDRSKTTVAPYSLRATEKPMVSTPLHWEELDEVRTQRDVSRITFDIGKVPDRLRVLGDLFSPVSQLKQRLPNL